MKLSDIVSLKPGYPSAEENDQSISADTDLFNLTEEEFSAFPDTVTILNDQESSFAHVDKSLLAYIRDNCRSNHLIDMLEHAPVGIIAIDDENRIFYVNATYSHILGVPRHRVLGQRMDILEPKAAILDVVRQNKKVINRTVRIHSVKRYVRVNITSLERHGRPWGAISFFIDETEKNLLAGELSKVKGLASHYQKELEMQLELPKDFKAISTRNYQYLQILRKASIIAQTETSVLIQGESGIGKEVLARAIHAASPRSERPFIAINCAALPQAMFEAELFGYEDGALAGAKRGSSLGKFELADKGVLFLDEIGDLPVAMQAKLLRVLQEKGIEKIGRKKTVPLDVRVIASTNQNLEKMVTEGSFRADLFYRLNIAPLTIPPLRSRLEDIDALAEEFIVKFNRKYAKSITLSSQVRQLLLQHSWPGNVRELANTLEYAVIMCNIPMLLPEHLPPQFSSKQNEIHQKYIHLDQGWKQTLHDVEKSLLEDALEASGGNRSQAMRRLGLSRKVFYTKLKQHNLFTEKR